jgi:hypothetical protein
MLGLRRWTCRGRWWSTWRLSSGSHLDATIVPSYRGCAFIAAEVGSALTGSAP